MEQCEWLQLHPRFEYKRLKFIFVAVAQGATLLKPYPCFGNKVLETRVGSFLPWNIVRVKRSSRESYDTPLYGQLVNSYHILLAIVHALTCACVLACCAQVGSAYRETLSRVREVAEAVAVSGTGSSKEERAEVGVKVEKKRGDSDHAWYFTKRYDRDLWSRWDDRRFDDTVKEPNEKWDKRQGRLIRNVRNPLAVILKLESHSVPNEKPSLSQQSCFLLQ